MEVYHCAIVSTWTWWMGLHKPLPLNSTVHCLSVCLYLYRSIHWSFIDSWTGLAWIQPASLLGLCNIHTQSRIERDAQWHCLWYIAPQTKQKRVFRSAGEKLGQMRIDDDYWEMFNLANCCLRASHFIDTTILVAWWFRSETVCFSSVVGCWAVKPQQVLSNCN